MSSDVNQHAGASNIYVNPKFQANSELQVLIKYFRYQACVAYMNFIYLLTSFKVWPFKILSKLNTKDSRFAKYPIQAKSNIHVNPNFRQTDKPAKAHINPSFSNAQLPVSIQPPKAHVNPKFRSKKMAEPEVSSKTYINPNFVQRPLPEIPKAQPNSQVHINPSFLVIIRFTKYYSIHT